MAYLEVRSLSKSYKGKEVLAPVSFEMEQGETLVIIGDSGSGKTTLLRLLNFLETPDGGTITLAGQTLYEGGKKQSRQEQASQRAHFGLVFQNFNLFPHYNVYDNILLPLKLKDEREKRLSVRSLPFLERRSAYKKSLQNALQMEKSRVEALLKDFHLEQKKDDYPYSLSGGEAQRVAIARALALQPEILCFDEPTSALDPRLKNEVALLVNALRKKGNSLIVVTHEIAFASLIADRVLFLENGMIKEQGDGAILQKPQSQELRDFLNTHEEDEGDERGPENQTDGTR